MNIHISGAGIICALGNSPDEVIASFRKHKSGIEKARNFNSKHQAGYVFGEVKMSNQELAALHNLDPNLSRTILLSYHAANHALATLPQDLLQKSRVGFISATSVGGMDKSELYFRDFLSYPDKADLKLVRHHDCGKVTDYVAKKLGIKDFVSTISTACSSSANAIMLGARMIKSGQLDIVIAGGVDSLTKFTFNGFNTLQIVDPQQCSPLNANRAGLNLGEGASYVVLMSEELAKKASIAPLCRLSGYANSNDAFHQTALSDEGEGPFMAMNQALMAARVAPSEVDYLNLHGTGTQNNDAAEGRAIERLFSGNLPKLSSTKSFTGHTLGACGAIEAVFSALSVKHGYIFPNYSFNKSVEGLAIVPEQEFQANVPVNHVLSNSFGFGGNCSSLIFSKA